MEVAVERIDLNSDMGESFGAYTLGDDDAMLRVISSANVACGFHAGDPLVMDHTCRGAVENNVRIGAHPGFQDLQGFGRRAMEITNHLELEKMVIYQIGALDAIARARGAKVEYVKFHGALAHLGFSDARVAETLVRAVKAVDRDLLFLALPHTESEAAAERAGLRVAREIFADRAYDDRGMLVPRSVKGSVLKDPEAAAQRILRMLSDGELISISGNRVKARMESVCVHGDTPGAVAMAVTVRKALEQAGVTIQSMCA